MPGGPPSKRPRTHAPRTMFGCGRKISRLARSSASVGGSSPGSGVVNRGSTAMRSASFPHLHRADDALQPEHPCALQRSHPQPVERAQRRCALRAPSQLEHSLGHRRRAHDAEHRNLGTGGHVAAEADCHAGRAVRAQRHHPARQEQVRGRAMRDARARLHEARHFALGKVDRVREDRPLPERAGAVVDIEVVNRLREEPPDLVDLAVVLGEVRLPVRAVLRSPAPRTRAASRPSS